MAIGQAVGLKRGHVVTAVEKKERPGARKGRLGKRVKIVRELIREVSGYAPYEKRVMELLKVGKDKVSSIRGAPGRIAWAARLTPSLHHQRALKVAKKKVCLACAEPCRAAPQAPLAGRLRLRCGGGWITLRPPLEAPPSWLALAAQPRARLSLRACPTVAGGGRSAPQP